LRLLAVYNQILMSIEILEPTGQHPDIHESLISQKYPDLGRVASAALFFNQPQLPPGRVKVNGHGVTFKHTHENASRIPFLLKHNSLEQGQLELQMSTIAEVSGLLQAQLELQATRTVANEKRRPDRLFIFVTSSSGELYDNMKLESLRYSGKVPAEAIFSFSKEPLEADSLPPNYSVSENKYIVVPVNEIAALRYAMPETPK
jgi:hypothetical protein